MERALIFRSLPARGDSRKFPWTKWSKLISRTLKRFTYFAFKTRGTRARQQNKLLVLRGFFFSSLYPFNSRTGDLSRVKVEPSHDFVWILNTISLMDSKYQEVRILELWSKGGSVFPQRYCISSTDNTNNYIISKLLCINVYTIYIYT